MNLIKRTAEVIASEILIIRENAAKALLSASIEIGARLIEAKELVPYGEWGTWLEDNFEYSQSTANNLMAIANEYQDKQYDMLSTTSKAELFGKLTYSQAVALLPLSVDERAEFVQSHDMEEMSVRDIQAELRARKQAEEDLEDLRDDYNDLERLNLKLEQESEGYKAALETSQSEVEELRRIIDELKRTEPVKQEVIIEGIDPGIAEAEKKKAIEQVKKELNAEIERLAAKLKEEEESAKVIEDEAAKLRAQMPERVEELVSQRMKEREAESERQREEMRAEYERKLAVSSDKEISRFGVLFENFQREFSSLMESLAKVADEGARGKLRNGLASVICRMKESVESENAPR